GERVKVIGTVRNRTTSYTIQFNGIDAESFRNAKGGILTTFEGGSSPETQAGQGNILPPFPIDHELKPGESKVLTTTILTDSNGAASGTVTWKLPVNGILVDDATGEETDLTAEDILFISDIGGLDGDPMAIALIQDNSKPPLPPLAWWEPAAHYYEGVMYGIGHWTYSTFDTMGALARGAGTASNYLDSTEDLINLLGQEGLAIWHLGEYLHHTWQELSEEEIEAFLLDVSREVQRRTLLSSTQLVGLAKADLQDLNKVLAYVREQTLPLFSNVENAYVSDDPRQIADLWGQISGNVVAEVASAFIPNPKFTRYANSAELRKLASSADNIRLPGGSQEQMLRRMKSGPVTDEAARWGWGAAGAKFEKAIEIMKDFGIRGYARERAPKSVFLIENGEAIAKAEAIKAKGMNELDFWLINDPEKKLRLRGNPGGNDNLNLDAVTVLFRPPEDEVILGWMADQDPRLIDAVLERAKARRKEYDKYRADFETFRETGVEVDFNYRDNDAVPPNPDDPPGFKRGFDYEVVEGENGIEILVPRMTNQDGFLRYISGDIDWVHFSFLDGTPLDPETAGKFYKIMSRCCGLEHGDAFSWIKEGQTVFEGKANQLADYISGLKALLEVSGDGKRAVRIKENLSYISGNNRKNIIYFDNGIKSTALDALQYKARLEANFFKFFEQFRPYRATLLNWSDRFRNVEWEVDKTPDAEILDEDEDGSLRRFNGSAWENTEDPSQVEAKGLSPQITAPFIIAPITNLDTNVEAGSVSMKLVPFNELYAVELAEKINSWFSDGDVIVFDPGNSFQEVRKIVSASPLLLDWPLDHFHSENAIVAVLPENLFEASDRQEQVEVVRIIHNENDKTLRLAIRIPYLSTGFLESGTDMANWMPLTPVAVQGGLSADDQLMVTYPGETLEITINIQNLDTLGRLYLRLRDPGIQ
ncbi:MAG: hypothetical protein KJT03_08890, partial [Verrucomicrobiae bacterium]|nr:hypothetical protein [Verrucomicrobiae bacterium]